METGLVDGLITATHTWASAGIHEVTEYILDQPFMAPNGLLIINLNTWNEMPEHLQDLMTECAIESDREMAELEKDLRVQSRQKGLDIGVELIQLSSADAERFLENGYQSAWEYRMEQFPEVTPTFEELLSP